MVNNLITQSKKNIMKGKGISPLLATVLLIATTVVISTMLAGWMSSTTSATQNTIANRTTEGVACAAAEIVIDDVYTGAGSGSIARAIVRNSGGSDNLVITSAQLYDKFGNNFTTTNALPTNLNKGQMATLNFNYSILPATTNDSAHGINNGTLTNGPNWTLDGKYGGAMLFDGVNDQINAGNSPTLNFTYNNFTMEAWIKPRSTGYIAIAGATQDGGDHYYWYAINPSNILYVELNHSGWQGSSTLNTDGSTWYHVALVKQSTSAIFYINGILDATITGIPLPLTPSGSWVFRIGSRGGSQTFNGFIDDVAVWNRSLTNAEINTSMSAGPLSVSNTNDLVGYWNFDEGRGVISCPDDFSRVVVTTNCGGVSTEFSKRPKC